MALAVRQIALIANPTSGGGSDPGEIAAALRDLGARVGVFEPDQAGAAAGSGAERIAVAGGDGSIAPAAAAAGGAGVPLAVIPVGTANDFARGLGLPDNPAAAVRLAAEGSVLRSVDLCRIDGRPFLNAASAGLAAAATRRATGLKKALGPVAYMVGAVRAGLSEHPLRCVLRVDGERFFEGEAWQVTVAGTGSFGAGSELEQAEVDDGLLDVAVMEAGWRLRLMAHAYGLRTGRLARQSDVHHSRASAVDLEVPEGTNFNVDGELLQSGPVRLRVEARAFELVTG